MSAFKLPGASKQGGTVHRSCPIDGCTHPRFLHEVDEIAWPRIERCTVQECRCSGVVELRGVAA